MAQEEFDPLDLMSRVAMLILEARTPHPSAKGRVEGPHCPGSAEQQGQHRCSQESFECLRASEFRQRLNHMWRNGIPSCIDVVLYPDCLHGRREAQSLEMSGASVQEDDFGPCLQENCLLLEHWNIQSTKKRHGEWTQGVAGSMLLQAVRSYLYFSQLSSWLASMNGCIPSCIACRLYAPGEEGGVEFTQHPESHAFPSVVYGPHGVKVSVMSLPRQQTFPIVLCVLSPQGEWAEGSAGDVDSVARRGNIGDSWSGQRAHKKLAGCRLDKMTKSASLRSSPARFKPPAPDKVVKARPPDTALSLRGQRTHKADATDTSPTPSRFSGEGQGGWAEERKAKGERSSAREALEGQLRPLELTTPETPTRLDLHSPKVLMSEGIHPAPLVTRRKRLDLSGTGGGQLDERQWLMKTSPVSPLDMHKFLTNLHALTTPIPSHVTPFSQSSPAYRLQADCNAAMVGMVPLPGPELHSLACLPAPAGQHGGRFRKKKALPFSGEPPQAQRSDRIGSCGMDVLGGRDALSPTLLIKNILSSSQSVDAAYNTKELLSLTEAKARDAGRTDKTPAPEFCTEGREEKGVCSLKSPTPAEPGNSQSAPALFQHSTHDTLSDSTSRTLSDLNKVVWPSEAKPTSDPSLSIWPGTTSEAFPTSSSSSSSSSTYSSSPIVSTEGGRGGARSDASTPTNLSCSPVAEDSHPSPCSGSRSSSPPLDQSCLRSNLATGAGPPAVSTGSPPICRGADSSITSSPTASLESQEGRAVTPDSSEKAFKATSVKRRLELVDLDGSQPKPARDRIEGGDVDRNLAGFSAEETSSSEISLTEQAGVSGSAEQASLAGCAGGGGEHRQVCDGAFPRSSLPCRETPPTSTPSCSAPLPDQVMLVCGDNEDEDVDDDTQCMFYLESPPSPEPCSDATAQPKERKPEVKDEAWLLSSFAAFHIGKTSKSDQSPSRESQFDHYDGDVQPVANGFTHVDVVNQNLPHSVAFIGKDTNEDVVKSSGLLGKAALVNLSQFTDSDAGKVSSQSKGVAVSNFRKDLARTDSFLNCSWDVQRDAEPADDGKPSFTPDFSPVDNNRGDNVIPPSIAKSSSTKSSLAYSLAKSALSSSLAKSSQGNLNSKPCGTAPHCYDSTVDIHVPYHSQVPVSDGVVSLQQASSSSLMERDDAKSVSLSSSPGEEDSVFYEDSVREGKACDSASCPIRTKSAPSFGDLSSSKSGLDGEDKAGDEEVTRGRSAYKDKDGKVASQERLRSRLVKSASLMFSSRGSLPSQSSPAPVKRRSTGRFDYDETLTTTKAIKSAISLSRLTDVSKETSAPLSGTGRVLSTSAPASTNCLLGNFEESILNGRLEPAGIVDGFSVAIGASGSFCPRHLSLPVTAYFFNLSDDNAPSPYLGHIDLEGAGKRGYHIPNKGTLQVTLFNPNRTVVKMFVVRYDLEDMPPNCQTIIRQRTVYMPSDPASDLPSYLRYLIHLRVTSSSGGKIYLHTDVRLIFARNKFELDSTVAQYELRSFTETPVNPKYSPKR